MYVAAPGLGLSIHLRQDCWNSNPISSTQYSARLHPPAPTNRLYLGASSNCIRAKSKFDRLWCVRYEKCVLGSYCTHPHNWTRPAARPNAVEHVVQWDQVTYSTHPGTACNTLHDIGTEVHPASIPLLLRSNLVIVLLSFRHMLIAAAPLLPASLSDNPADILVSRYCEWYTAVLRHNEGWCVQACA